MPVITNLTTKALAVRDQDWIAEAKHIADLIENKRHVISSSLTARPICDSHLRFICICPRALLYFSSISLHLCWAPRACLSSASTSHQPYHGRASLQPRDDTMHEPGLSGSPLLSRLSFSVKWGSLFVKEKKVETTNGRRLGNTEGKSASFPLVCQSVET
jgi:hypothetical protein